MSKQERPNAELSPASKVVDLGENRAERAEIARRQEVLEIFKEIRREANSNFAPFHAATEAMWEEWEAESDPMGEESEPDANPNS